MIKNVLTRLELESIFIPILQLDEIEAIKKNIYKIFYFTRYKPTDTNHSEIGFETTGILTMYKGFEITIKRLDYDGVKIQFKREKTSIEFGDELISIFLNPINQIVRKLKNLCKSEICQERFVRWDTYRYQFRSLPKEYSLYQYGALPPKDEDWRFPKRLPIKIYTKEDDCFYLVEFSFNPTLYVRERNKTFYIYD